MKNKKIIAIILLLFSSCEGIKFQGDLNEERYELREQEKAIQAAKKFK